MLASGPCLQSLALRGRLAALLPWVFLGLDLQDTRLHSFPAWRLSHSCPAVALISCCGAGPVRRNMGFLFQAWSKPKSPWICIQMRPWHHTTTPRAGQGSGSSSSLETRAARSTTRLLPLRSRLVLVVIHHDLFLQLHLQSSHFIHICLACPRCSSSQLPSPSPRACCRRHGADRRQEDPCDPRLQAWERCDVVPGLFVAVPNLDSQDRASRSAPRELLPPLKLGFLRRRGPSLYVGGATAAKPPTRSPRLQTCLPYSVPLASKRKPSRSTAGNKLPTATFPGPWVLRSTPVANCVFSLPTP